MFTRATASAAAAVSFGLATAASAQFALVVDSGNDRISLLDAFDGSVINETFIDVGAATGGVSGTIQEAIQVGNEIWLSDQTADRIWRFSSSGALLGEIGVGSLNNIRGFEVVGGTAYIAQGSGGDDGTPEGIVTVDVATGQITGSFAQGDSGDISYFDVLAVNNELWVTNIDSGNDAIQRFDLAGNFLGNFATSDGESSFDFLQQIALADGGATLIGGGFSVPSGVFAFDIASGADLGVIAGDGFGPRGVFQLGNGEILWGNGAFLVAGLNPDDGVVLLEGGSYRYISATTIPAPAGFAAVGVAGLLAARRRR